MDITKIGDAVIDLFDAIGIDDIINPVETKSPILIFEAIAEDTVYIYGAGMKDGIIVNVGHERREEKSTC